MSEENREALWSGFSPLNNSGFPSLIDKHRQGDQLMPSHSTRNVFGGLCSSRRQRDNGKRRRHDRCTRRRRVLIESLEERNLLAVSLSGVPEWQEVGPAQIHGGLSEGILAEPGAGAIEAVAPHPGNADVLFVGSVNGGIWRTTNATNPDPDWTPLTDDHASLSIGALAISPFDRAGAEVGESTPWEQLVVYAGTKSVSNSGVTSDSIGILRSEDGGQSWHVLDRAPARGDESNILLGSSEISSLVPTGHLASDGEVVVAGTDQGLFRSVDGGHFFRLMSGTETATPLPAGEVTDILVDPANDQRLFATIPDAGIYRSGNSGATWDRINTGIATALHPENIKLAAQRVGSSQTVIYAGFVEDKGTSHDHEYQLTAIYRTTDYGDHWIALNAVPNIHPGGNGLRNFSLLASEDDPNVIYVGGDRQETPPYVANLMRWRPDAGDPTDGTWESIVLSGANGTAPHADSREIVFDADGVLIEVDDGGIYRLNPPDDLDVGFGTWTSLNGNLAISEQYSVAYDQLHEVFLAGTQDNGSAQQRDSGDTDWGSILLGVSGSEPRLLSGDGNTQQIDNSDLSRSLRYSMSNSFRTFFRHAYDTDNRQVDLVTPEELPGLHEFLEPDPDTDLLAAPVLLAKAGQQTGINPARNWHLNGLFPADRNLKGFHRIPYVLNAVNPNQMLLGYRGLYESVDRGDSVNWIQRAQTASGRQVSALVYGWKGPSTELDQPDLIYAARDRDVYVRRPGSGNREFESIRLDETVVDIAVDPQDWRVAYVATTSGLFRVDVGTQRLSPQRISTNIFDTDPSYRFHSIEVVRRGDDLIVLLGGQDGVYRIINPNPHFNTWAKFGQGLPAAPVMDLDYHDVALSEGGQGLLVAATLGRGTWIIPNVNEEISTHSLLNVESDNLTTFHDDRFRLRRDQNNPTLLRVFVNDVPQATVPFASLEEIHVHGGAGSDTLRVDSTFFGPLNVPSGIHFDGDDGIGDTIEILVRPLDDDVVELRRPTDEVPSGYHRISGTAYGAPDQDVQQLVYFNNVVNMVELVSEPEGERELSRTLEETQLLQAINGLLQVMNWTSASNATHLFDVNLPLIGDQLHRALDGATATDTTPVSDPLFFAEAAGTTADPGTSFLHQVFTSKDPHAVEKLLSVQSAAELRAWLDDLDDVPGNVPEPVVDGATITFDLAVEDRTIGGTVAVDTELVSTDGDFQFAGLLDVSATADVHLKFGADPTGFFINPEDNEYSEFSVGDLSVNGDLLGRAGMLGISVPESESLFTDGLSIDVDLHDPGTVNNFGLTEIDGLIRLQMPPEFLRDPDGFLLDPDEPPQSAFGELGTINGNQVATVAVVGAGSGSDLTLTGQTTALPVQSGAEDESADFAELANAELTLVWPDIEDPSTVQIDRATSDTNLLSLLNVSVNQVIAGLTSFATSLEMFRLAGELTVDLPFLNVSIDGLLEVQEPVILDETPELLTRISEVVEEDGLRQFTVTVQEFNLPGHGVAVGDPVEFRSQTDAETLVSGVVESVTFGQVTVSFDGEAGDDPDHENPLLQIQTSNSLASRLRSVLGEITDFEALDLVAPTIQDLIYEVSGALDVDPNSIPLRFIAGSEPAIEFSMVFEPDPIELSRGVDFGRLIPGLSSLNEESFNISLTPRFSFGMGIDLTPFTVDEGLSDHVWLSPSSEISVGFDAVWDGASVETSIGFLDVFLASDGAEIAGSAGYTLADFDSDGRVYLSELETVVVDDDGDEDTPPVIELSPVFDPIVTSETNADIQIVANVGTTSTLPEVLIQIDRNVDTPDLFADLATDVANQIAVQAADFINYDNISPEMILQMLPILAARLEDMVGGELLEARLPLINQSVAEMFDLATSFSDEFSTTDEATVQTAAALGAFLGADETVVGPDKVSYTFQFAPETDPMDRPLSLGLGSVFSLTSDSNFDVDAGIQGKIVLGISTAEDLSVTERFFIDTTETAFGFSASADLGGYGSAPFGLTASVLSRPIQIVGARGLLELSAGARFVDNRSDETGDNLNELTLLELAEAGFTVDAQLGTSPLSEIGSADRIQLLIPLNGDGGEMSGIDDSTGLLTPSSLSDGDAVIEVLGRLSHIPVGLKFAEENEPHRVDALLDDSVLDELSEITVHTHNLDGFVTTGLLDFDGLFDGLDEFLALARQLLGDEVLDFKLPFVGKSVADVLDFVGDASCPAEADPESLAELVGCLAGLDFSGGVSAAAGAIEGYLDDNYTLFAPIAGRPFLEKTGSDANPDSILFQFEYTPSFTYNLVDGFDLGLDYVSLTGPNFKPSLTGSLTMLLGFGIDREQGFFIQTFDEPEIQLTGTLNLSGDAALHLGFIDVAGEFDGDDELEVNLAIDLGDAGDRITMSELISGQALHSVVDSDMTFTLRSHLDVPITVNVDVGGPTFPLVETRFVFDWSFSDLAEIPTPSVSLDAIEIPVADIINEIGGGAVDAIRENNPLSPILDELNKPLPILGKSLLQLFTEQQENEYAIANNPIYQLLVTASSFPSVGAGDPERYSSPLEIVRSRDGQPQIQGHEPDEPEPPVPGTWIGDDLGIRSALIDIKNDFGITFPILEVRSIFDLLIGQKDVDLIRFVPPAPLKLGFYTGYDVPFATFGIPSVASADAQASFSAGVGLEANLSFGFDTSGLRDSGESVLNFLNGLWIGDFAPGLDGRIGPGDRDVGEVALGGSINASIYGRAEVLGYEFARISGTGYIEAGIAINLNDDNLPHGIKDIHRTDVQRMDGKFHLDEIATVLDDHDDNPICLFDLTGGLEAGVELGVKIKLPIIPDIKFGIDESIPILSFELACPPPPRPRLLAELDGTTLSLTGPIEPDDDAYEQIAASNHPDGDRIDFLLVDKDGDGDRETLRVKKGTVTEDFGPHELEPNKIASVDDIEFIQGPDVGPLGPTRSLALVQIASISIPAFAPRSGSMGATEKTS